jgi:serine/threonine protein kinase
VAELAGGLQHAHDRNVLHRDLKPSNILLAGIRSEESGADPKGNCSSGPLGGAGSLILQPRITDFGLAKLLDQDGDQTSTGALVGSPPYMAPEQAEGRLTAMGPATDVYGLGAVLYELLTGRPPFLGESHSETLRLVATAEPIPPRKLRPSLPRDIETIGLTCLAKRPERRYASAAALAADLERFLEGRPIAARPTPAWERAVKWARRRPSLALLVALIPVLITVSLAVALGYQTTLTRELAIQREELTNRLLGNYLLGQLIENTSSGAMGRPEPSSNPPKRPTAPPQRAASLGRTSGGRPTSPRGKSSPGTRRRWRS